MPNIVEQAARIIAPEAFDDAVWYDNATGKPHEFGPVHKAKQEYLRSQAISRAIEVLRLAVKTPDLKDALVQDETERWADLGIPRRVLDSPDCQRIISAKW